MIRDARPDDFLAVALLDREGWKQNRHAEFVPDGEHVWRIWCEHAMTVVAEEAGRIVGVIVAFPCVDSRYCLHKILVDPTARHRGIGAGLMASLLARADRLKATLFLTVDPENSRALELYDRAGFTEREFFPGYYRDTEDRFVLTRRPGGTS